MISGHSPIAPLPMARLGDRLAGTPHERRVALLELAGLWEQGPPESQPFGRTVGARFFTDGSGRRELEREDVITRDDWRALRARQALFDSLERAIGVRLFGR